MPRRNQLVTVKTSEGDIKRWRQRVDAAAAEVTKRMALWKRLNEEYRKKQEEHPTGEDLNVNILFRLVEQKKAALFFRNPEMRLRPRERMQDPLTGPDGQPMMDEQNQPLSADIAVKIHEEVLNYYLGPDEVNFSLLMDRLLVDCLVASGRLALKVGYRAHTTTVQQPVMTELPAPISAIDGMLGLPQAPIQVPAMDERGRPLTEDVEVILHESYEMSRISPGKLLVPASMADTDFEAAPWLGHRFRMSLREAKRAYDLPESFEMRKQGADEHLVKYGSQEEADAEEMVEAVEIFYRASRYVKDVVHPEVFYQLVLIDGLEDAGRPTAAVHRMSPYQELREDGQLTPASMRGNPIHVGTLRDLTDSAWPASDCEVILPQSREINTYRRQSVAMRDANIPKFGYDVERLTPEAKAQFQNGDVGQWVAMKAGALENGMDRVVAQLTQGAQSRVEVAGAFQLEQDAEKAMALGANQVGARSDRAITATEAATIQGNANVRLEKEQDRVLQFALGAIRKLDSLLQQFADSDEIIEIVGEDGVKRLEMWNKDVIAGRFAYDVVPDSQLSIDMATERAQVMQYYNLTAQDPFNNRKESLKKVQRTFGIDPARAIQEPPPESPVEPSVNLAFKGEDFVGPQAPIVLELMRVAGIEVPPHIAEMASKFAIQAQADAVMGQPGVPGPAERLPAIDKGQGEHTGQLDGQGAGTGRPF